MRRSAEFAAFVALAAGLHLALAVRLPSADGGSDTGGQGGDASVSVAAASEQVAALVEKWDRPPETPEEVARPETPPEPPAETPPEPVTEDAPPPRSALAALPEARPDMPQLPSLDRETPPPPTPEALTPEVAPEEAPTTEPLAPVASPRPPLRPEQPKPAPERPTRSTENSAPQQATKSAGSGGSAQAGVAQSSGAKTLSRSQVQSAMSSWGSQIRARIERRKRHPGGRGGRVTLQLTVTASGQVTGAQVVRSSGNPRLDQAAMTAVRQAGRMPNAPAGLTAPSYTFDLPMDFN